MRRTNLEEVYSTERQIKEGWPLLSDQEKSLCTGMLTKAFKNILEIIDRKKGKHIDR